MNFTIYASITAVLTTFFALSYLRQRKPYQIAFTVWIPSTLLQYLSHNRVYYNILSVIEILFFLFILVLLYRDNQKQKQSAKLMTESKNVQEGQE